MLHRRITGLAKFDAFSSTAVPHYTDVYRTHRCDTAAGSSCSAQAQGPQEVAGI